MGIHGDDVLRVVRDALKVTETCSTQSQVRCYPRPLSDGDETCSTQSQVRCYPRPLSDGETPTNTWQKRDGRLEFDCVGRDWFRAFRITIEPFPVSEFDEGDYTTEDWLIVEPRRPRFDWYWSPWALTVYLLGWSLSLGVEREADWGWMPIWIKRGYFRPSSSPTGRRVSC